MVVSEDSVSGPTEAGVEEIEALKRASTAQLLFRCARRLNEQAIERLRARAGVSTLRVSHTTLFPHIDFAGTRLTELARRVGISKQAVAQLVDELEAAEVLERVPDPSDGRAKLIRFRSQDGVPVLTEGLAVLSEFEAELEASLGKSTMQSLHEILVRLDRQLALSEP